MRVVILGATAGIGRDISDQLASDGHQLFLVASDSRDVDATISNLRLRFETQIDGMALDIADLDPTGLCCAVKDTLGSIDALFILTGVTDSSDFSTMSDVALQRLFLVNCLGPARAINTLLPLFALGAKLVVASSIAAVRPRGTNAVYGAAKRALEHYVLGLRHALSSKSISVCCYRLGYIRTAMTFGQRLLFPAATSTRTAKAMIQGLSNREGLVYYPSWWSVICWGLGLIPWPVYRRLRLK